MSEIVAATSEMSSFAWEITKMKYAHQLRDGETETWDNIAYRATKHPMKAVGITMRDKLAQDIKKAISQRKFLPGGRYLYASGRPFHQTQNCLLMRCHDSREGWSELLHKASMALMTGAGIGIDYSEVRHEGRLIRRTGGYATGPLALMQMVNECGRGIMQGGSRRSAIWAGLIWDHGDIHKFIKIKNWSDEVKALKAKDFNFPATLDCTNISVILNDEFFEAYEDFEHPKHAMAHSVYWATVAQMLETGEPGFSIDTGKNSGESLRNAPVAANTMVLTRDGYKQVEDIVGIETDLWTGFQWAPATFVCTQRDAPTVTVNFRGDRSITCEPSHEFFVRRYTGRGVRRKCEVVKVAAMDLCPGDYLDVSLPTKSTVELNKESYTAGFVLGDGSERDVTLCTDEKKELAQFLVGIRPGIDRRGYDRYYLNDLGVKSWIPEVDCIQSFLAGWFDADGSYDADQQRIRLSGEYQLLIEARRLLEQVGIISTISKPIKQDTRNLIILSGSIHTFVNTIPCKRLKFDVENYMPYRSSEIAVQNVVQSDSQDVYCCDVGVEEHSFVAEGVRLSNCTEITSRDDSDICNLGSINMARVENLDEFKHLIDISTAYLLAGTVYSDVPYSEVDRVRSKNRRLGLGLMGIHEWLLRRGKPYGPDHELGQWLSAYSKSGRVANKWADEWDLSRPKKTRALAPNGTIAIAAETTGSLEPIFCVAYKRRFLKGSEWYYQYVVDPAAKRLIEEGVEPSSIEDAYTLAQNVERRVEFQAWVQKYVDHGISSTINLPAWGSEYNNSGRVQSFGKMLIKYLPDLRGITCYPDGSRGGQPLVPCSYEEAIQHEGADYVEETANMCDITKGGSCGD